MRYVRHSPSDCEVEVVDDAGVRRIHLGPVNTMADRNSHGRIRLRVRENGPATVSVLNADGTAAEQMRVGGE